MKKPGLLVLLILLFGVLQFRSTELNSLRKVDLIVPEANADLSQKPAGVSSSAFEQAISGYRELLKSGAILRNDLLTVIDYSLPSNTERMWIIDMKCDSVLKKSLVAHGRNSGALYAENFSNEPGSYSSSLGFFCTGSTYHGKHGLSLYLDGLEPGINDNARDRAIVMHAADYATDDFARQHGRLGRSLGCPSIPPEDHDEIINLLAGGSCLFIYAPDEDYETQSRLIKSL